MEENYSMSIALSAIGFIVADEKLCPRFMALTGLDAAAIRAGLDDPNFLIGALDFLLMNEPDLLAFCDATDLSPDIPLKAKQALGNTDNWDSV